MSITSRDQFTDAMLNNSSRLVIDKASISNAAAGQFHSLWRATGQPGQAAVPTTAAVCTHATTGAMGFTQQTDPATSYLALLEGLNTNSAMTLEVHDRLVHSGGLVGNVATAQTTNAFDLSTLLATSNLDARKGDSNYSDVQWWAEWYTDTGATVATMTVNVTYDDASTGNLTGFSLAATRRASLMVPLNGLIPAASAGKYIRGWNSVTLSVSTGTAGNFGITATRYRGGLFMPIANARFKANWVDLGSPEVRNSSCLMNLVLSSTTTTGTMRGTGKIIHG
jgi:hypothetical protein